MSASKEEPTTEDWKVLTSMDTIVHRMEISGCLRTSLQEKSWKSRAWAAVPMFLVIQSIYHVLVTNLFGTYMSITRREEDLTLIIIDHISYILQHGYVIVRILTFFLQSPEIRALVVDLNEAHKAEQFNGETVKHLLQNVQTQANRLHQVLKVSFKIFSAVIAISLSAQTVLTGKINIRGWFPLDLASSPGFEITFLLIASFSLMLPLVVGQLDTFIICFLYNLASQFEIICYKFEHIREQAVRNVAERGKKIQGMRTKTRPALPVQVVDLATNARFKDEDVESDLEGRLLKNNEVVDEEMCRLLGALVDHQVALLRLTRKFEKIFNPLLNFQIVTNLFLTSLCVFLITMEGPSSHRLLLLMSMAWLLVSEMMIFCYLADKISTQNDRLRDCAFSCAWPRSSARFNKSLRVVMSMANRKLRMRVSSHVPLSMETFAQITKFSWSMLTLAKTLTDPAKLQ